jgi:hypothetical protein
MNTEVQRMHSVVHHTCLSELMVLAKRAWSTRHSTEPGRANDLFAAPQERLSLPRFFLPGDDTNRKDDTSGSGPSWETTPAWLQHRRQPPAAGPEMLNRIAMEMEEASRARRALMPDSLNVYVDGELRGSIDLHCGEQANIYVTEFDRWLKIAAPTPNGDVLLGVFALATVEPNSAPAACLILEGGQRLTLLLQPEGQDESGGTATIVYGETKLRRKTRSIWDDLSEASVALENFPVARS